MCADTLGNSGVYVYHDTGVLYNQGLLVDSTSVGGFKVWAALSGISIHRVHFHWSADAEL